MAEVTIADVRTYNRLSGVEDNEITAHLESAKRDFASVSFASEADYKEAVSYQTIINVAPILWARGMNNFPGYETIYTSVGDIEKFIALYKRRIDEILERAKPSGGAGFSKWAAV
jgi:hypothetical protein